MTTAGSRFVTCCVPALLCLLISLSSCEDPATTGSPALPPEETATDELFRVGAVVIREPDLLYHLKDRYEGHNDEPTRKRALEDLVRRAQFANEALEAGLRKDPVVSAEVRRLLETRLRESRLKALIAQAPEVSEQRLRAIYQSQIENFQSPETRKVAVLWLDSGPDPERVRRYRDRLTEARTFAIENKDIADHPGKGFSILGADYSEHSASRFRGGIVGWLGREGSLDPWSKAVANIAFSLETPGDISEVTARAEGVFLVRLVERKPAVTRSFESVAPTLKRAQESRTRENIRKKFEEDIISRQDVQWNTQP